MNPCCPSNRRGTLTNTQHAILEAEKLKRRKYEGQAQARGHEFMPLAFGTHGDMAGEVGILLRKLAANTLGAQGHAASDMELDLAFSLVRGNAQCAGDTMARAFKKQNQQRAIIATASTAERKKR